MAGKDSKYISYSIASLFTILPFVHHSEALDKVLWPQSLLLGVFTLGISIYAFIQWKNEKAKIDLFSIAWLLFFVLSFIGLNQIYSMPEWLATTSRFLLYGVWAASLYNLFRLKQIDLNIVFVGLSIGGLISAGQASMEALQLKDKINDIYQVAGLFGHKNFTSAAILLYLPASIYLIFQEKKQIKYLGVVTAILSLFAIGILRTRGVWLGAIGGLSVAALLFFVSKIREKKFLNIILGSIVAFVCVLGITLSTTASGKKVFDRSNIDLRMRYWEASTEMIKNAPITGVGSGQWKINFPKYGLQGMNESVSEGITAIMRPHNDFLWVTSELGILGGLIFIFIALYAIYSAYKTLKNQPDSTLPIISTVGIVGYLIYGLGEFPIERTTITALFILYVSYLSAQSNLKSFHKPSTLFYSFLIVAAGISTFVAKKRMDGEVAMSKVIADNDHRDAINIVKHADQAKSDYYDMDFTANPVDYFAGMGLLAQQKSKPAQDRFDMSLVIHPWHIVTLNQYGNLFKYQKQFDRALEMYDRALEVSPKSHTLRLNKAEVLLTQKKYEESAMIVLSCFGNAEFYNDQKYRGLITQSFKNLYAQESLNNAVLESILVELGPYQNDALLFERIQEWKSKYALSK